MAKGQSWAGCYIMTSMNRRKKPEELLWLFRCWWCWSLCPFASAWCFLPGPGCLHRQIFLLGGLIPFLEDKELINESSSSLPATPSHPCPTSLRCIFFCPFLIRDVISWQRIEERNRASGLRSTQRVQNDLSNPVPVFCLKRSDLGVNFGSFFFLSLFLSFFSY